MNILVKKTFIKEYDYTEKLSSLWFAPSMEKYSTVLGKNLFPNPWSENLGFATTAAVIYE